MCLGSRIPLDTDQGLSNSNRDIIITTNYKHIIKILCQIGSNSTFYFQSLLVLREKLIFNIFLRGAISQTSDQRDQARAVLIPALNQ